MASVDPAVGPFQVLGFLIVDVDRSHGPCFVKAVIKAQCLKFIDPSPVIVGPEGEWERVDAADADAAAGY